MGIGASVFLLALGAILTFAVRDTTLGGWLDINVVGWILMAAGVLGLVVTLIVWGNRRRTVVERPGATTYERRVIDEDIS
jgi:tetrahydromethanopterin S-methyltransferase subunit E